MSDPTKDSIRVTMVEPELEELTPRLKEPFDLNELNYFAAKLDFLEEMGNERLCAFSASVQAGRHCGSVAEMINLVENMNRVDLQPAFSAEEYGAFQIDLAQDEFADEMDVLENSEAPSKIGFADYISDLEHCLDIKSYGKLVAEREGGVFTNYGYLTETSPFQEVYRGTQDIPAKFQACPFPHTKLLLKLEHTDLTDVLTKIHDLGGYENDLEHNLEIFHRRRRTDFLLLLNGDKAVLSEAMHVYREGTASHDAFVNAADAKMFSIYVTDFQTDFIGDIREVDAAERRADILAHSIEGKIYYELLNGIVLEAVQAEARKVFDVHQRRKQAVKQALPDREAAHSERKRLLPQIALLERRGTQLYEDYADGKLDRDGYLSAKAAHCAELSSAEARADELNARLEQAVETTPIRDDEPLLRRVLDATTVTEEVLSLVDCVVVYDPEHIEIRFAFADGNRALGE